MMETEYPEVGGGVCVCVCVYVGGGYNDLCTQGRLWSASAYVQSDQSLRCSHEKALGP